MDTFLATVFLIICILLILVVLLQKGRGGGLGGAFGAGGHSAFGTRTGDVFTWVTIVVVALFLLLSVGLTLKFRPATERVETPMFDPPSGPIAEPQLVRIACRPQGAKIFYTVDGSTPARGSQTTLEYDVRVRVTPGMTVKAVGHHRGWKPSEVAVAAYPLRTATAPASAPATAPAK